MLKTRRDLTRAVTAELRAIEELLDQAQVRQAQLIAIATQGRRDAKLPLFAGEDALALVADAQVDLLKTRKAIHAAHYAFRDVREQMGIRAENFGDYGDTPREYMPEGQASRPELAVVAAHAA
jgi:hypothetical protein